MRTTDVGYLLNSDCTINALGDKRQAGSVIEMLLPRRVHVSWATLAEVYEGAFDSPNPQARLAVFQRFLSPFTFLPLTEPIAERFAEIRALLHRRGQPIPDLDIAIAATALQHDLTLLTFNRRHVARIPDLRLYEFDSPR